jgi:hypothetical protein
MAQGQAPTPGASVAAAQNVFVKAAASSSKADSNNTKSGNPATNDGQIYASGACRCIAYPFS